MQENRRILFDDMFDLFSMLIGSNYVTLYDIKTRVTRYSPAIVDMVGLPSEYIPDGVYDWMDYIHPEDREKYETAMSEMLALRQHTYDLTYRIRLKSGEYSLFRFVGGLLRDSDGHPSIAGGMMIDYGRVDYMDRVTALRNLQGFLEDLRESSEDTGEFTILLVGFGRLAHFNEVYGYSYGSRLLQQVGAILCDLAKDTGSVYRLEGSKFAILSHKLSKSEMAKLYEKIRILFKRGVEADGIRSTLIAYGGMISIGGEMDIYDRALYDCLLHAYAESKNHRYGGLVIYNGSLVDVPVVSNSIALINAVRTSMTTNFEGFFLLYQPIFSDAESSVPIAAECLLKWKDDRYGIVSPHHFLPEIERDYEFRKLGYWIFKKAMTDGKVFLNANSDFKLLVNVLPSQLEDPYFADNVEELAQEVGFPLKNLSVELTGECRMLDMEKLCQFTTALKNKGIRIGIDDFGSGNAWLKTITSITPDHVRFSRKLTANIAQNEKDLIIFSHLSNMTKACGIQVFVKGIETEGTMIALSELPIDGVQGTYFSDPIYFDEVLDYYDTEDPDYK